MQAVNNPEQSVSVIAAYWRQEFARIRFTKDEAERARLIQTCSHAAQRNDLTFKVKSSHSYLHELMAAFSPARLSIEPEAGYTYTAPLAGAGVLPRLRVAS